MEREKEMPCPDSEPLPSRRRRREGQGEGSFLRRFSFRRIAVAIAVLLLAAAGTGVSLVWPAGEVPQFQAVKQAWRPSEAALLDRHGEVIDHERLDFSVRRLPWAALDTISPALIESIVEGEDRAFWRHHGVDWRAVLGAVRDQSVAGRRRGASTITMQLASLIDPRARAGKGGGALARKFAQVRIARGIERHWSKQQILEAYLNLLGFRGELQGIGAASQLLAGKAPSGLTAPESLVLAALLPAPAATVERVVARGCARTTVSRVFVDCGTLRATAKALLDRADASKARFEDPQLAPQLARTLLRSAGQDVQTTLDARIQRLAREALARHLSALGDRNVRDGAVLVADNHTGDVLAYVGSAGPQSRSGQVDGVRARRQAGSTLKPFLYELALERRYLTAASLLDDSPITLDTASGVYLPQNYDRDFKGPVSVRTALASSLNVPAVRTLVLTGVEPFRERLRQLGYAGITEDGEFYGYSLALGSAEVSLWEQVQAYRTLARGGRWSPLKITNDDTAASIAGGRIVLPPDATFVVADIMSDRAARALTFGLDNHLNTPFWSAVKTGTSKDMRDNWCIGFSGRFTVGVWVGNFEGDSMHDVSGVTGAAPVWNELMTALHANSASQPLPAPASVTRVQVAFSPAVEPPRREWFLGGTESRRIAALSTGTATAQIASPANGMIIAVDPDIPPDRQRVPFAARGADDSMTFRLNGETVGTAGQGFMWLPVPGNHSLELIDSTGHIEDRIAFVVR